jgi:hypothetical protein
MRTIDTAPAGFTEFLRGGREKNAEDLVAGLLSKALDDMHVLLRGVALPNGEKLGFVLVGPEGVWHLELLHLASLVNSGGVWMHWDYAQQSVQPVPVSNLAAQAQSKHAHLREFLAASGVEPQQAVVVAVPKAPHDFSLPGVEMLVFIEELEEFATVVLPQHAPATPLTVEPIIGRLMKHSGEASGEAGAEAEPKTAGPSALSELMQRRVPQLGNMLGWQIAVLAGLAFGNCCLLSAAAWVLLR